MGDPISLTGTAVGVVSLGITVCQSLVSYYASWKDYEDDVGQTHRHLEDVSNRLQVIQTVLQADSSPPEIRRQVETAVLMCTGNIGTLERKLAKVRNTKPPIGIGDKVKAHFLRAQYPFKEATLKKLKDSSTALQTNLGVAISLLNTYSLNSIQTQVGTVVSETTLSKQDIGVIKYHVGSVQATVEDIHQALPVISNETASIGSCIQRVEGGMEHMNQRLQVLEPSSSLLSSIQVELQTLPSKLVASMALQLEVYGRESTWLKQHDSKSTEKLQRVAALDSHMKTLQHQLIDKPSLLQSTLDEVTFLNSRSIGRYKRYSKQMRHSRPLYPVCVCSVRQESSTQWIAGSRLQLFTKVAGTHSRGCPLFSSSWQTNTIGIKYIHAAAPLRVALELSLTATRGAGGISLSPLIQVRGFVRNDSPAFKLIDELNLKLERSNAGDSELEVIKAMRQIRSLFDEGKAKPGDVNTYGETILGNGHLWYCAYNGDPQRYLLYQRFVVFLAQLGVPVDEVGSGGWSTLTLFLEWSEINTRKHDRLSKTFHLLHQFGTLTKNGRYFHSEEPRRVFWQIGDVEEYAELFGCGGLSEAVLAKSKASVNRILAKHPQKIHEQNQLGQTPLHLSADWAWGISRLLEAKAPLDAVDTEGQSPIHYAATFNCLSIIQRLLAAGSPLDELNALFRSFAPERELPLENFKAIVDALADRRRQLAELAKTVLSSSDYVMLVGSVIGLLDQTAYGVYKRIIESGHPVGPALRVSQRHTSVYHYRPYLTVEKANLLYNAGFYNVDAPDEGGYTPLMVAATDLDCQQVQAFLNGLSRRAQIWLGRLPLLVPCKYIFSRLGLADGYRAAQFVSLDWVLNTIYGRQGIPEMIINDFFRWFLFLELGITHTCCILRGWDPRYPTTPSPEEISEIQDEEKELTAELEALCQEASLRWRDHRGSFVDFLQPFLQEVHERPSRAFSRKDVRRIEEIGVVLQPGTVVECDSGSEPEEEVEQDSDEDVFEDAAGN